MNKFIENFMEKSEICQKVKICSNAAFERLNIDILEIPKRNCFKTTRRTI